MSIKEYYKNYKKSLLVAKQAEHKLNCARYDISKMCHVNDDDMMCFKLIIADADWPCELITCPKFQDTYMADLSQCYACSLFAQRLRYEMCKREFKRAQDKKINSKQELQNMIKQSLKKLISKGR